MRFVNVLRTFQGILDEEIQLPLWLPSLTWTAFCVGWAWRPCMWRPALTAVDGLAEAAMDTSLSRDGRHSSVSSHSSWRWFSHASISCLFKALWNVRVLSKGLKIMPSCLFLLCFSFIHPVILKVTFHQAQGTKSSSHTSQQSQGSAQELSAWPEARL